MFSAGTIAAYLTLDAEDFDRTLLESVKMLGNVTEAAVKQTGVLGLLSQAAGSTAGQYSGQLVKAFRDVSGGLFGVSTDIIETSAKTSEKIWGDISAVEDELSAFRDNAPVFEKNSRELANSMLGPFSSMKSDAYVIMKNTGDGMISGLNSRRSDIIRTAQNIASSVVSTIKNALKISSPSKVMRTIGEQSAQGLAMGLGDVRPEVSRQAGLLAGAVTAQDYIGTQPVQSASAGSTAGLAEKLDTLISMLAGGEQTMQVDGRVFARLIREYS